jgi:hypothetical protein
MPDWIINVFSNQWAITIGGGVAVIAVVSFVGVIRRAIGRAGKSIWTWLRQWRITRDPRSTPSADARALPPFVEAPRWQVRRNNDDRNIFGIKNAGGTALHVRIRAEQDEVDLSGTLDLERVEAGQIVPFRADRLAMDGIMDTWLVVNCRDAAGNAQQTARVKIPGYLM